MKCPNKKQVLKAAATSKEAHKALKELFPEMFLPKIQPGEFYCWGTDTDGGAGVVIAYGETLAFVNSHAGMTYLQELPKDTTKIELNERLAQLPSETLHNCYNGTITGPKRIKSWCYK